MGRNVNNLPGSKLSDVSQSLQSHLRVIAKVATGVSLLATLVLGLTVFLVFGDAPQTDYFMSIQSAVRDQDQLMIGMLIGGTLIILLAGLITWLISLYSSARVAGPLYRLARNIEMEIEYGPVAVIQLREEDQFQQLAGKMDDIVTEMNAFHGDQLLLIDRLDRSLSNDGCISSEQYSLFLQRLKSRLASPAS